MTEQEQSKNLEALVTELLSHLGFTATVEVGVLESEKRKYWDVKVNVPDGGSELIGRHGSTLDSLSVVIGLMLPKESYGILLDINGYRDERSQHLTEIAQQAAQKAVDDQHEVVLEPMRDWERRMVHTTLSTRTDITTESIGEGSDRRVVIKPITTY